MNEFRFEDFDIDLRNPLGIGAFGEIFKATKKNSNEVYAIKRIPIYDLNEDEIKQIEEEEITSMNLLKECENSINFFGYFKEENFVYLIMELCDGSLNKIIKTKNLNAKEIKEILQQLNNVFKIMHENAIIHRDIKPENILIKKLENNKYLYILTDYGLSKQLTNLIMH